MQFLGVGQQRTVRVQDYRVTSRVAIQYPRAAVIPALVLLAVTAVFGGKHPVPLDANVDGSKCLECHEEKSKGKVVHAAVALGCTTCHQVQTDGEITRIKLKAKSATALCFQCHEEKKPEKIKGPAHPPALKDCLKCHNPHVSENKNLLLKPASGGKSDNLCLTCHDKGLAVDAKGSRHPALDMGCDTCHVTHKTGDPDKPENAFHLTQAPPALCISCHDVKEKKLADAHRNQPFAAANCSQCHDAHDSKGPKLAAKHVHSPFADRSCDTCHEAATDGKVKLTQADRRALCLTCHDEVAKKIESAKVIHAGAQGECTACHDAHAGLYPRFIKPNPVAACEACHSDQAQQHKTSAVLHDAAFNGSCSNCHAPHGGDRPHLLLTDPSQLCLGCHYGNSRTKVDKEAKTVTFPWGRTLTFAEYGRASKIGLDTDEKHGHPMMGHPLDGKVKTLPGEPDLTCLSCHQPHASANMRLFPASAKNTMQLCGACHVATGSEKK